MNIKLLAIGLCVIGFLPTLSKVGEVQERGSESKERGQERREQRALGLEKQRGSQAALEWSTFCIPMVHATTGQEFIFSPGDTFIDSVTQLPLGVGGDVFACNSQGFVGRVEGGIVREVVQVSAEDLPQFQLIFNQRQNAGSQQVSPQ